MTTWRFLINPFLVAAQGNRKRAVKLSTFTYGALDARKTDPFFGPQFLFFKPLHNAVIAEEAELQSQIGTQKGKTLTFDELLDGLTGKLNVWDPQVQVIFAKGTPGYLAVFPQGHHVFQAGGKDARVAAVAALSLALGAAGVPPGFAPIKVDVDAYLLLLNNARTAQSGAISVTETESDEATVAVVNAMNGLYKVLGACIAQFYENPTLIEPIFDLQTLRSHAQTEWTASVDGGAIKNVFKRTLAPEVQLRIKVNSTEPIKFYFAAEKNDAPGAQSVTVSGLEEEIVTASQLGNVPVNSFFKTQNQSAAVEGHFEIEIL
jgi:hypothetical protein